MLFRAVEIDLITEYPALNFCVFADAQENDPEIQKLSENNTSSLKFVLKPCQMSDSNLRFDSQLELLVQVFPNSFRKLIFDHFHKLSHPGIAATIKLICTRYEWPGMKRQIKT